VNVSISVLVGRRVAVAVGATVGGTGVTVAASVGEGGDNAGVTEGPDSTGGIGASVGYGAGVERHPAMVHTASRLTTITITASPMRSPSPPDRGGRPDRAVH